VATAEDGAGWPAVVRGVWCPRRVRRATPRQRLPSRAAQRDRCSDTRRVLTALPDALCPGHQGPKVRQPRVARLMRTIFEQPDAACKKTAANPETHGNELTIEAIGSKWETDCEVVISYATRAGHGQHSQDGPSRSVMILDCGRSPKDWGCDKFCP
jgi:hypothetical protein